MSDDILRSVGILRIYELLTGNSSSHAMINGVVRDVKVYDGRRVLQCPEPDHLDSHPSCLFNEKTNYWRCLARGTKGTMLDLIRMHRGISGVDDKDANRKAVAWLREALRNSGSAALAYQPAPDARFADGKFVKLENERLANVFHYRDLDGTLRYQVLRFEGTLNGKAAKRFSQRRPLPPNGRWIAAAHAYVFQTPDGAEHARIDRFYSTGAERAMPTKPWANNLDGVERIPYRLRQTRAAALAGRVIFIPEGEPHADEMETVGFAATTNSEGSAFDYFEYAQRWKPYFAGAAAIYILADCDDTGRFAARMRARALTQVGAAPICAALDLWPERKDKYDIRNFLHEMPRMNNAERARRTRDLLIPAIRRANEESEGGAHPERILDVALDAPNPDLSEVQSA